MSLKFMNALLLFLCGASAIRRHPGVDETKFEIFSDAVHILQTRRSSSQSSRRFGQLLQEWEGSTWSDANYTTVIEQIENDLVTKIEASHNVTQSSLDRRMNDLACKRLLVQNAYGAAVKADQDCNVASQTEKAEVKKLTKALTKLKNLDLIRQRSKNVKLAPTYSYPGSLDGDGELASFACKFDKDSSSPENCDIAFEAYENATNDLVQAVQADLDLESATWSGFVAEENELLTEQNNAVTAAKTQYGVWVTANNDVATKWNLREHHICYNTKGLNGASLVNSPISYYGLASYEGYALLNQVCAENENVPISYQRQHTDFCYITESIQAEKDKLDVANNTGSAVDQNYEVIVLKTILCILDKLKVSETITETTGVGDIVTTCEGEVSEKQVEPYVYTSDASFDCKTKVVDDWCFTNFDHDGLAAEESFETIGTSSASVPSCTDVFSGIAIGGVITKAEITLSGSMHYRWREELDDPFQDAGTWSDSADKIAVNFVDVGYTGKSFLTFSRQASFNIWAYSDAQSTPCAWDEDLSETNGWESKGIKPCTFPVESEYREAGFTVKYELDGDNSRHAHNEIITQCESPST